MTDHYIHPTGHGPCHLPPYQRASLLVMELIRCYHGDGAANDPNAFLVFLAREYKNLLNETQIDYKQTSCDCIVGKFTQSSECLIRQVAYCVR